MERVLRPPPMQPTLIIADAAGGICGRSRAEKRVKNIPKAPHKTGLGLRNQYAAFNKFIESFRKLYEGFLVLILNR